MPKLIIDSLDGLNDALKTEYEKQEDGTFRLKVEGEIPEVAELKGKLKEFRDNNITLLKEKEDNLKKLEKVADIDPAKYKSALEELTELKSKKSADPKDIDAKIRVEVAAVKQALQEEVQKERQARLDAEQGLKRRDLEGKLRDVGTRLKVAPKAMSDFLARGLNVFGLDGLAREGEKQLYSEEKPTEPLGMEEWGKMMLNDAPHLFEASSGGGTGSGTKGRPGGKKTIDGSDPVELGRNIDAIAKGEVIVVNSTSQ